MPAWLTRTTGRVHTRLLAALLLLLASALTLAVVAWIGLRSTQRTLAGFEEDTLPGIAEALELAERTAQLAAIMPHLAESRTRETLDTQTGIVETLLAEIRRRSQGIAPAGELGPVSQRLVEGVGRDLSTLIALTRQKQQERQRLNQQLERLEALGSQARGPLLTAVDPAIPAIWSSLMLAATTGSDATLGRLEADVEALLLAVAKRRTLAPLPATFREQLLAVAEGGDSVLTLRRKLLDLERRSGYLVGVTRGNADQLSDQVGRHVAGLRAAASARSEHVSRAVRSAETTMVLLALASLLVAAGATQYVRRLLAQIENITAVMTRLAGGDASVPAAAVPATRRRDELGALARAFEVFRENLLAKQQLVRELKQQRELLEAVHESMIDALAVFDDAGRLVLWNPRFARLLRQYGMAAQQGLSTRQLAEGFPPDTCWTAPGYTEPAPLATLRASHVAGFDHVELRLPDGQIFDLRSRRMPDGGVVTLITDLTARRAVETQLQHAQKLDVLGQLTGGVAHDFNNYLGTVLGNLALLEERQDFGPAGRTQLQRAQRAATRAAALTRRLLAFARRQPLQAEAVAVDEMLEEMRDLIEYSAGPQVTVHFTLAAGDAQLLIDRGQLENALLNLVINSAAAMPEGGDLHVATRLAAEASPPTLEITVTDTGVGIPEALQAKVFEPFFTTKAQGEGSGLGLSIVYGFVKQSGGTLSLASKVGSGTTVSLGFPVADLPPQPGAAMATPAGARASFAGMRILLVDDDEAFRTTVADMLEAAGAEVLTADSGETALWALETEPPVAAVVSDVRLGPGIDGFRLARLIRQRHAGLAVGLMSGVAMEAFPQTATRGLDLPFLQKPFTPGLLYGWLGEVVRR